QHVPLRDLKQAQSGQSSCDSAGEPGTFAQPGGLLQLAATGLWFQSTNLEQPLIRSSRCNWLQRLAIVQRYASGELAGRELAPCRMFGQLPHNLLEEGTIATP